jgi:hypothetical protein
MDKTEKALARYEKHKENMRLYSKKRRDDEKRAKNGEIIPPARPVGRPRKNVEAKLHSPNLISYCI